MSLTYTGPNPLSNPYLARRVKDDFRRSQDGSLPYGGGGPTREGLLSSSDPRIRGGQVALDQKLGLRPLQGESYGPQAGTGPMQTPSGIAPTIGGTLRGGNPVGGATLEPNLAMNPGMSFGGTHDDGYRIGPGDKTGDGKFHDTFGTGLDTVRGGSAMASMGRDLQAGRRQSPLDKYAPGPATRFDGTPMRNGGPVPGRGTGDKIRALLDPREFVMKPEAVKRIGVENLEKLNDGDPLKFRDGGHVAKAKYRQQGIGLDYGDFGSGGRDSGYLDQRYIHAQTDPLTGLPRNANQFDIDRKRRELLHSGDIEALAQFDNLNHATRSGDPRSLEAARDSFAQFRAARQYYASRQQPQVPSIADRGPVVDVEATSIQPTGVQGISSMLQKAGQEALSAPRYTPTEDSLNGPLKLGERRAILDPKYGTGSSVGVARPGIKERTIEDLNRRYPTPASVPNVRGSDVALQIMNAQDDLAVRKQAIADAASKYAGANQARTAEIMPPPEQYDFSSKPYVPASLQQRPSPTVVTPVPAQDPESISGNIATHFGGSPLGSELVGLANEAYELPGKISSGVASAGRSLKKSALNNPNFAQSILGRRLQKQ